MIKDGLNPVVDGNSRILILGTIPGDESLKTERYYSHAKNDFWVILSKIYVQPIGSDYKERLEFLRRKGLALWDVLRQAERPGSLDSAIRNLEPNHFGALFEKYPELRTIAFNGTKAQKLYHRHVASQPRIPRDLLRTAVLPSTSPTPGRHVLPFEEKVAQWKAFLT